MKYLKSSKKTSYGIVDLLSMFIADTVQRYSQHFFGFYKSYSQDITQASTYQPIIRQGMQSVYNPHPGTSENGCFSWNDNTNVSMKLRGALVGHGVFSVDFAQMPANGNVYMKVTQNGTDIALKSSPLAQGGTVCLTLPFQFYGAKDDVIEFLVYSTVANCKALRSEMQITFLNDTTMQPYMRT